MTPIIYVYAYCTEPNLGERNSNNDFFKFFLFFGITGARKSGRSSPEMGKTVPEANALF